MGSIIRPTTTIVGTALAGGLGYMLASRAWDGKDDVRTNDSNVDAPDGKLFSDGISGTEVAAGAGILVAAAALGTALGATMGAIASAKFGALPSASMRWGTTLGVMAPLGAAVGALLAGTRDRHDQVEVYDTDIIADTGGSDSGAPSRFGMTLGDPVGPAEGFKNVDEYEKWDGKLKDKPKTDVALIEDPMTKRITLRALTRDGAPMTGKTKVGDSSYPVGEYVSGFTNMRTDAGKVVYIDLQGGYGLVDPETKYYAPKSAREAFNVD